MMIKEYYNFADYSKFERAWVFSILCKDILCRKDLLEILKHFNMRFLEDNWEENVSLKDIGSVIDGDIKRDELLPYLKNYIKENYPKLFTFEEAEKIYNTLMNIDSEIDITKLWMSIEKDSLYLEIAKETLEFLEKENDNKENSISENKIEKDGYFKNIVEEIIVSLYKLAMKSYN